MKDFGRRHALAAGMALSVSASARASAGTPMPIVDKLSLAINQAIRTPTMVGKAKELGMDLVDSTPASSRKFYEEQMAAWRPIVKASGIKVE